MDDEMSKDLFAQALASIVKGDVDQAVEIAKRGLDTGIDPLELMTNGFIPGINEVGDLFGSGGGTGWAARRQIFKKVKHRSARQKESEEGGKRFREVFKAVVPHLMHLLLVNDMNDMVLAACNRLDRALLSANHAGLALIRIDIVRDDFAE
jgi:hypothetical protein